MAQKKLPSVILRAGEDRRVRAGHPWAFSNEILMDADAKAIPPGSLATLRAPGGEALGLVTFNPHSLIAARVLSTNPEAVVACLPTCLEDGVAKYPAVVAADYLLSRLEPTYKHVESHAPLPLGGEAG